MTNETHDPQLMTWVASEQADAASFPVQNLPFGRFAPAGGPPRLGVAIGDSVLDLSRAAGLGLFDHLSPAVIAACRAPWLNALMGLPVMDVSALRLALSRLLRRGASHTKLTELTRSCLFRRDQVVLSLPVDVRNFSDFFASVHHARNSGRLKRPDNPLLPNFHSLPVAYHGRASTLAVDGTAFRRPKGQRLLTGMDGPAFGPTTALDFECELGIFVGAGNTMGTPIPLDAAPKHVFGFSLLNDWSARDLQAWESTPLGPFLAKSFISTLSPWVVTLEALAPFRIAAAERERDAPGLLSYLMHAEDRSRGGLDIEFKVALQTSAMGQRNDAHTIGRPLFRHHYWTVFQMLTHQTSNGCAVLPGDLLGSGTVSGARDGELGCLMESTLGGTRAFTLPNGETRTYLEDGDKLIITAACHRKGFASIGFGSCTGLVLPAHADQASLADETAFNRAPFAQPA